LLRESQRPWPFIFVARGRARRFQKKARLEVVRHGPVYTKRLAKCREHLALYETKEDTFIEPLVESPSLLDAFLAHYVSACYQLQVPEYVPRHA